MQATYVKLMCSFHQRMKRFITIAWIGLLCLLLGSLKEAGATHLMGSDIIYRCLGNGKYEIIVRVYRDCNGIQLSQSPIVLKCNSNTITINNQTKVSVRDITGIDPNCPLQSKCQNQWTYGVEEHVFKATVDLSSYNCCEWEISWQQSARNSNITTGMANQNFYTFAQLNKCVSPCNSSPDFTNPPVAIICHNQDFIFNNGALDTVDVGDSLSYEFATALQGPGQSVNYSGNFSPTNPITYFGFPNKNLQFPGGIHLDPLTGDLSFRPTQMNQIAVVVIEVKEWRMVNGVMTVVGVTRRDMQIIVIPCPNNKVPKIKPPYSAQACAGQKTCITIETEDDDQPDTVKISWNRGIRDATFTHNNGQVKHASGEVCWTPTENDVSNIPYTFTITAKDNSCSPFPGQSVRAFSIFVRETPNAELDVEVLTCGNVAFNHTPKKNYPGYQFNYLVRDSNNNAVWASNQQVDTAFLQPGKYLAYLNMRTSTPCLNIVVDSFEVEEFVRIKLPEDTVQCNGIPILLESETSGGSSPFEYEWAQMTDTGASPVLSTAEDYAVDQDTGTRYLIRIEDDNGCKNYDTVFVNWHERPIFNLGPDQRICQGSFLNISSTLDTSHDFVWSTGDTTNEITLRDSSTYWLIATDSVGCTFSDTIRLNVNVVTPDAGPDRFICKNDTLRIGAGGADTYKWYLSEAWNANPSAPPLQTGKDLVYPITKSQVFILEGTKTTNGVTCSGYDSVQIWMNPLPEVTLNTPPLLCENGTPYSLIGLIQFPTLFTGSWSSKDVPQAINNGFFYPNLSGPSTGLGHPLTYRVTDANGCSNEATVRAKVNPKPQITLLDSLPVCGDVGILALNDLKQAPANTIIGVPKWFSLNGNPLVDNAINKTNVHNQTLDISQLTQGLTYGLVFEFTSNQTTCTNRDTTFVRVKKVPQTNAGTLPNLCWNEDPIDLSTSGASPAGGTWTSSDITLSGNQLDPKAVGVDKKFDTPGPDVTLTYTVVSEGCSKSDDVTVRIKGIPDLQLTDADGWCESSNAQNLNALTNIQGGMWSGTAVSANRFDPGVAGPGSDFILHYDYTDPVSQCHVEDSISVRVQAQPELELVTSDKACAGVPYDIEVSLTDAAGVLISTDGDGEFGSAGSGQYTSTASKTTYHPGTLDNQNLSFTISAQTTNNDLCPPATESKYIEIFALPVITLTGDPLEGCDPLETTLEVQSDALPGANYRWTYSTGKVEEGIDLKTVNTTFNGPGTYTVQVIAINTPDMGSCESVPQEVQLNVLPTPVADFTASRWNTTVALPGIQFEDLSTVADPATITEWHWEFNDKNNSTSNTQNPFFEFPVTDANDTGSYLVRLRVVADNGCEAFDTGYIHIAPDITVFIPNAFTPNGFGESKNDRFYVIADGFETFEITIFNRWGEKMYYSNNITEGWDGKYKGVEAQQDVYMYVVKITSLAGKEFQYYGTITLLR